MNDSIPIVVGQSSINLSSSDELFLGIALVVFILTLLRIITVKSMYLNAGRVLHNK